MSLESSRRRLSDPAAMRAFAHPVRLALHELLMRAGAMTAADAAREVGISQALASYHLRQLAKYGFVEQAAARDERERPWKATEAVQEWDDEAAGPEQAAARSLLEQVIAERALSRLAEWQQHRGDEPEAWRGVGGVGNLYLYATAEEVTALGAAMAKLLGPLMARVDAPSTRPAGARPVLMTQLVVPLPPTDSGD
ncbi:helix-turn-helix domain-containing protein [Nonomuraea angiospora]|uniref:DNA-binding MarR family transcriptional regulator n=2 Tax=Nonomuraea angiospora TaxID=46172 RepID=A0ABR9LYH0_9ACTN|nr:helix-turn-helix domain-containing protein [Nonomuraea angiospora]MBE1585681.1 DNA-binding MarR family transcriptional regulator [Nonomuraea angiospora]